MFSVRIDKALPTVGIETNGGTYTIPVGSTTVTVSTKLNVTDETGSSLNTLEYAWGISNTQEPTNGWTEFTNGETISKTLTGGNHYLWTRAVDGAGNRAEAGKVSNVFKVQYQVLFDTNGGTETPAETVKEHGTELVLNTSSTLPSIFNLPYELL